MSKHVVTFKSYLPCLTLSDVASNDLPEHMGLSNLSRISMLYHLLAYRCRSLSNNSRIAMLYYLRTKAS